MRKGQLGWQPARAAARGILLTAATVACVAKGVPARAQDSGAPTRAEAGAERVFDIPAGPLGTVLTAFGEAAGYRVLAATEAIGSRRSPGVSGRMAPEQALRRLLAGTGMTYRLTAPATVTLIPLPAGSTDESGAVNLPEINVSAGLDRGWSPVRGYVAPLSATGTRADTPIIETPQSISVITRDQMDAQRADTIGEAIRYTPGIMLSQGFRRSDETFVLRGFQGSEQLGTLYRDGMRWGANNYGLGLTEPYGLERVEVLRGPASIIFGATEPGGIVNLISKRPSFTPLHEIELSARSDGNYRLAFDLGGPLDAEGTLAYRLTGAWREGDTMIDHIPDDRRFLQGGLTWRPGADTSVTFLANYYNGETRYSYGYPFSGTVLDNRNGRIASNRFVGEPGFDYYRTENLALGYLAEHRFDDVWTVRQNVRYLTASADIRDLQFLTLLPDQRTVTRSAENRRTSSTQFVIDNQVQARLVFGPVEQTIVAGLEYTDTRLVDIRGVARVGVPTLDLFAPRYGTAVVPVARLGSTLNTLNQTRQIGLYLQDQVRIADRLILSLGGRYDWVESDITNRLGRTALSVSDGAFSGRFGLVYLFDSGFAPYASYAESFQPTTSGTTFDSSALRPTRGRQYEVGIRYQPPGRQSLITVAGYELTKENVTTVDPAHPGFVTQAGEVRARGVEVEGRFSLDNNIGLIASYAYTDARITRSNGPDLGRIPAGVPTHQAALWADYTVREGALEGLGFGAGLRYISTTRDTANSVRVPDYTLADAMVRYDFAERWRLSLNVTNLFDRRYVASCTYACFYGDRLTATAALRYRW
ncbi:TonB-dependent siderophore receptor [Roseomonas hellenica]|uniref:TonB-dependent siderophore receptor n=1 Tax=Plastoroseomonas hellenica TaxID=2687306 RepID=A0ABS5ERN2_9PROT|nr:TonB-dependent siderophore receptor [Plastoroseomonas hellenica]